jgi:PAS domain S-box-containing protein
MSDKTGNFDLMHGTGQKIRFIDIFDISEIQHIQDLFADATGVASIITMPDGQPITRPSNFCRLCNIVRITEKGLANCLKSDMQVGGAGEIPTEMILKPCMSVGLWDTGASITVDGIHLANWMIGQVRNEELSEQEILEYAAQIGADKEEFKEAFHEVPVMSADRFRKVSKMLMVYANQLSQKAYSNYLLQVKILESERANELLYKSEESLSITLRSIGDGVISTDKEGLVVGMNPVAEKLCGWSLMEAKGRLLTDVFRIINSETKKSVDNPVSKVLESGQIIGLANHTVLISKDGTQYHISDSAAPIKNTDGFISGVVLVFSDVTDSYNANEKLIESERGKSVLLSNLPGMAYRRKFDKDWTMEFISNGCEKLTGYKVDDLVDNKVLTFNDMIVPEFRDHLWGQWGKAVVNKESICEEYQITTANGDVKWVWEQGAAVYDSHGNVKALEGLLIDITDRKEAEGKLIENEQYLNETQVIARLGTYVMDVVTACWTSSSVLDEIFGIEENYVRTTEGWASIIHPDWQQHMIDYFLIDVVQNKGEFDKIYKIIRKNDKAERWVHGFGALVYDNENRPVRMIGTIQDITDVKEAEDALAKSEEKYRSIFQNVQDIFYQIDLDGYFIEISPSVSYYSGYKREDFIGQSVLDLYLNPTDRNKFLAQIYKTGVIRDSELEIKTPNNKIYHVLINAQIILDSNGKPLYIEGFLRDISKRKIAEELLKASELKFRSYIQFAPHAVLVSDKEGNFVEVNPAACKITGYTAEVLKTMDQSKLISKDSFQSFVKHFEKAKQHGFAFDELTLINSSNAKVHISVDTVEITENLYLGFVVDITDRKNAEDVLKESEKYLIETQQIARLGNCAIDVKSGIWRSSEVLNDIFGISKNYDSSHKGWKGIIHPECEAEVLEYFKSEVVHKRTKFDMKFQIIRQSDNEVRWVHAIGKLKYDVEGEPLKLITTVQDITERKRFTDALRESEALYRSTLKASPDSIIVVEMDGSIRMVSPSALQMYLYDDDNAIIGRNLFEFLFSEDKVRAQSNTILMFQGYMGTVEYRMVRSTGEIFHAEINGDIIWTEDGKATGMVFLIRDVTGRKKAEMDLKKSQEQLKSFAAHLQNVREEERIMLAREIHDELGQILIAIKIDLGILKQKVSKSINEITVDTVNTSFDRVLGLVDDTINTTRKIMTDLRPEVLDLLGFVDAAKLYVVSFSERYKIQCDFENRVLDFTLSPQHSVALYRILQESLSNIARHSKATFVEITLTQQFEKLILQITDNGIGFDNNHKIKHDSYGIIGMKERTFLLDGEFLIESKIGQGTILKILIPHKMSTHKIDY